MQAYCAKASVDPESVAFVFDGNRLRAEQTPEEVDMEDVSCLSRPIVFHDSTITKHACRALLVLSENMLAVRRTTRSRS